MALKAVPAWQVFGTAARGEEGRTRELNVLCNIGSCEGIPMFPVASFICEILIVLYSSQVEVEDGPVLGNGFFFGEMVVSILSRMRQEAMLEAVRPDVLKFGFPGGEAVAEQARHLWRRRQAQRRRKFTLSSVCVL